MTVWGLVGIMAAAGTAGGIANHLLKPRDQRDGWRGAGIAVAAGIVAAFLMPLFLRTISSSLVPDLVSETAGVGTAEDALVFAGFCLLAAISSRAFIQTLSDRLLREVKETKQRTRRLERDVDQIEAAVDPLVEPEVDEMPRQAEPPAGAVTSDDGAPPAAPPPARRINQDVQRDVLKAFEDSSYTLRSASGVAQDLGTVRAEVEPVLGELRDAGLVREATGRKGRMWALTIDGRRMIRDIS